MAVQQRIGRVNSGDVSLFYRAFGSPGATPIIILHGSNYYDSYDWIGVASALAVGRGTDPLSVAGTRYGPRRVRCTAHSRGVDAALARPIHRPFSTRVRAPSGPREYGGRSSGADE